MLFNSYAFIFFFLPVTLAGFFLIGRLRSGPAVVGWLVLASLFYYAWWNPAYLGLLLGSIVFNYSMGRLLSETGRRTVAVRRTVLFVGVGFNLALIGYFKYAGFFVANIAWLLSNDLSTGTIVLPLAISFFTFQQIAFLVDAYRGECREYSFTNYILFVSFFPQLIAGPIVHHKEMMPQFAAQRVHGLRWSDLAVGGMLFCMGLFKKAVLADGVARFATPVFVAADQGAEAGLLLAWGGALAYTFQLYFDFSGYSDMAIGAARMFGIRLPANFDSPYQATSIIDFWRRWHMTLSRFLRDYVYIPLGGGRCGPVRRHVNLLTTMLIGGLWHGAGWTFVAWGGLHGFYLVINHGWRWLVARVPTLALTPVPRPVRVASALGLTFLAVVVGWVFFRAETFGGATRLVSGMFGAYGVSLPEAFYHRGGEAAAWLEELGVRFYPGGGRRFVEMWSWNLVLFAVAVLLPNSQTMLSRWRPALGVPNWKDVHCPGWLRWRPSLAWGVAAGVTAAGGVLALPQVSEFLYFQF